MEDSMILITSLIVLLVGGTFIGLYLENTGYFKIPEDQLMKRFLKLEAYRSKKRKLANVKK